MLSNSEYFFEIKFSNLERVNSAWDFLYEKEKTGRHLRARVEFYRARMSSRCTYLPIYICKK